MRGLSLLLKVFEFRNESLHPKLYAIRSKSTRTVCCDYIMAKAEHLYLVYRYLKSVALLLSRLLFPKFSILVVNPTKKLYPVVNPARGLQNRDICVCMFRNHLDQTEKRILSVHECTCPYISSKCRARNICVQQYPIQPECGGE